VSIIQAAAATGPTSYADLANDVKQSVVNIFATKTIGMSPMHPFMTPDSPFEDFFHRFFGDIPQGQRKTSALGSGFIIDRKGLILTNNHVVEKADEIKIRLANRKEYDAEVVGRDPKTDLALVKFEQAEDFPEPAKLGDSDSLRVGDMVMAVGNPFGLGHTVTVGIVSAKGRVIDAGPYDDFLQTDAAINPGNSGGPLFNMDGEVVGINTAIVAHAQGIGFATPISLATELLPQLKTGKMVRGWLGVSIQDITPQIGKSFNLESDQGVLIADLAKDGPADKAGLKRGDVIVRYKGEAVDSAHQLSRIVASTPPGTHVKVEIIRNGEDKVVGVNIGPCRKNPMP
jgi:serine protease Do